MNTKLNWVETILASNTSNTESMPEAIEYSATVNENSDKAIEHALESCIEKAVTVLSDNIDDDSRYFLFEWNNETSSLNIVVTDDTKQHDSRYNVRCYMAGLKSEIASMESPPLIKEQTKRNTDLVKYFVKDYLTTCSAFMQFSLVAVFHNSTRQQTELL